jgi:hypothetical protein
MFVAETSTGQRRLSVRCTDLFVCAEPRAKNFETNPGKPPSLLERFKT